MFLFYSISSSVNNYKHTSDFQQIVTVLLGYVTGFKLSNVVTITYFKAGTYCWISAYKFFLCTTCNLPVKYRRWKFSLKELKGSYTCCIFVLETSRQVTVSCK